MLDLSFIPNTPEEALWLGIGLTFARAFAKSDYAIQRTNWFKAIKDPIHKYIVKGVLDAFHHWWMGAILMIYAVQIAYLLSIVSPTILYWLGLGILIDDLPDLPSRIKGYFPALKDGLYG